MMLSELFEHLHEQLVKWYYLKYLEKFPGFTNMKPKFHAHVAKFLCALSNGEDSA